jgi:carboxylate-amine ligase
MEVNYGRRRSFSLGIEEEFQLLSDESFELVQRFDEVADAADEVRLKPELMQSVAEVATLPHDDVPSALADSALLRQKIAEAAAEGGTLIASAGTHPFSRWQHQEFTETARYQEVAEALQWVAERESIFGLHVHVGMPSAQLALTVANALRTWLPELLALSANSPFWQGIDTGLASTRSKVFDSMPRSGVPPAFASWEEFELVVERAVRAGFIDDYTYIWWDLRPHPRFGTIELRVCDAQTRLETVGAIAALTQSLAATLAERYEREGGLPIQPHMLIAENKWRAVRYGLEADLVDLERDSERPAREALRELVETARPAARRLGCHEQLDEVERILDRGTGADEQRRILAEQGTLLAVVQWLAATTTDGL